MSVLSRSLSKKAVQGNATQESLLSAARRLFGTHGYSDTSVDAIVHDAGVTKGAFYHHFGSKEEIFLKVVERVKQELIRAAFVVHLTPTNEDDSGEASIRAVSDLDNSQIWSDLVTCCRRYIELHSQPQVRRIVLVDARSVLTWEQWQAVEREHGTVMLRANLRRAMQRGLIQRLPLPALATLLSGALNEACMMVAYADDADLALAEAIAIVEQLLEGVRVREDERAD